MIEQRCWHLLLLYYLSSIQICCFRVSYIEVTSMVQLLLPVQVKGSVMENCWKEARTGKLEPALNLPTLAFGGNSASLTGAVEV